MEHLKNVSTNDIAKLIWNFGEGDLIDIETHQKENEDSQEFGFVIQRLTFWDSEIFLIGGYGLYTMSLSVNDGATVEELQDFIDAWVRWQCISQDFLKIRMAVIE